MHSTKIQIHLPYRVIVLSLENLGIDSYANADTNSDCTISRADIAVILKNANGKYKVTKDVNGDGKIDLKKYGMTLMKGRQ